MIKIGITGGIGSGKSTVCNVFKTFGVPVYDSDYEARILTNSHPVIMDGIKKVFGNHIYINGVLDRKKLGDIVFKHQDKLILLNEIIHPVVASHFNDWVTVNSGAKYVLKEAAILFESGANKTLDRVITVSAPLELRINRVMKRDNCSREVVEDRIRNQISDQDRIRMSDYVIHCDDAELVIPQVISIHQQLLSE